MCVCVVGGTAELILFSGCWKECPGIYSVPAPQAHRLQETLTENKCQVPGGNSRAKTRKVGGLGQEAPPEEITLG